MTTDVFNLNKACPAILMGTELSTRDFSKTLLEFGTHWCTVHINCGCPCITKRLQVTIDS